MNNFTVNLGSINAGVNSFDFKIEDKFFEAFTFSDIKHGDISAVATFIKDGQNISMTLIVKGQINQLNCDICADHLSICISAAADFIIKKTDENLSSSDEVLYIKNSENSIDLKHLIFELIVTSCPQKRQHALDKNGKSDCDQKMVDLVNKYAQIKETASDARWDALKSLT